MDDGLLKAILGVAALLSHGQILTAGAVENKSDDYEEATTWHPKPFSHYDVPLVRLTKDLLSKDRYDVRVRPILNHTQPLKIHISMSLYQIIEVNEPSQNIKMNVWMIQKWADEMLDWDPREYGMINSTILPHSSLWIPDTYLYNSVVMSRDETERYMNVQVTSRHWEGKRGANMSFLYPAIYTITCRLNVRYFPYDQQNCTLTISSWTNSKSALDYYADHEVNMQSFIPNEEWDVVSFRAYRHEYKYACCPEPWVIIEASLVIRRKPLYYIVNLIIPTSIITIVAITGFFTPASTSDDRTEKINLGITTLLAMSILMLMVSDQMPTTSEFVPLIAWFYLSIIIIISIGTFLTSVVLSIQGRRQYGRLPTGAVRYFFFVHVASWMCLAVPPHLERLWDELNDHPMSVTFWKRAERSKKKTGSGAANNNGTGVETNGGKATSKGTLKGSEASEPFLPLPRGSLPTYKPPLPPATSKRTSTKAKWLKVGSVAAKTQAESSPIPMIDGSNASSPRTPGSPRSRQNSLWDSTLVIVGASADEKPSKDKPVAAAAGLGELASMKRKRQCSLEWEFLATVLDRVLLLVFTVAVLVVTLGLILTGHLAQQSEIRL